MISKTIIFIMLFSIVLFIGGCGKGEGEKSGDNDPLEEYASSLINSLSKAKKAQLKASIPTIRLRINQFKQDRGRYPGSLKELNMSDLPVQLLQYDPETGEVSLE